MNAVEKWKSMREPVTLVKGAKLGEVTVVASIDDDFALGTRFMITLLK